MSRSSYPKHKEPSFMKKRITTYALLTFCAAPALQAAIEIARMALAPILPERMV